MNKKVENQKVEAVVSRELPADWIEMIKGSLKKHKKYEGSFELYKFANDLNEEVENTLKGKIIRRPYNDNDFITDPKNITYVQFLDEGFIFQSTAYDALRGVSAYYRKNKKRGYYYHGGIYDLYQYINHVDIQTLPSIVFALGSTIEIENGFYVPGYDTEKGIVRCYDPYCGWQAPWSSSKVGYLAIQPKTYQVWEVDHKVHPYQNGHMPAKVVTLYLSREKFLEAHQDSDVLPSIQKVEIDEATYHKLKNNGGIL